MMKRRISDLLDEIAADEVNLETGTPLSAQRIKEITMKKIPTRKPKHRLLSKAPLAAAMLLALALSAAAVERLSAGEWFRDIFREKGGAENLDAQVAYVDEIGKADFESQTDQGTTITPLAAYGDENICYLLLKVTGPEGTVLPDDVSYYFCNREEGENPLDDPELYEGMWVLQDGDPKDNEKEFLIKVMAMPEAEQKLNDGTPVPYHIYGLYQYEEGKGEYQRLLPGEFTLDLSLCNQVETKALNVDGISYYREEIGTQHKLDGTKEEIPYNYTVTFSEMNMSPLSISWICGYEMSDPTWKVGVDIQVIMKDGTQAAIVWGRGSGFGEGHDFAATRQNAFFDVPIDLKDVDYILIGGEHKVYLPTE